MNGSGVHFTPFSTMNSVVCLPSPACRERGWGERADRLATPHIPAISQGRRGKSLLAATFPNPDSPKRLLGRHFQLQTGTRAFLGWLFDLQTGPRAFLGGVFLKHDLTGGFGACLDGENCLDGASSGEILEMWGQKNPPSCSSEREGAGGVRGGEGVSGKGRGGGCRL